MNSDEEVIPASPPVKSPPVRPKRRSKPSPQIRSKRSRLSLKKYDKDNQNIIISKAAKSSTDEPRPELSTTTTEPQERIMSLDSGMNKIQKFREKSALNTIDIYQSSDEVPEPDNEGGEIAKFDVLSSAKLLEKANIGSNSSFRHLRNLTNPIDSEGLIPLVKIIEKESESSSDFNYSEHFAPPLNTAQCPKTPTGIELNTQFFGVTESQLWRVCSVADEVEQCLHDNIQMSEWTNENEKKSLPEKKEALSSTSTNITFEENTSSKHNPIVQTILKDFEVNSPQPHQFRGLENFNDKNDDELLSTQSLILKKRNIRTYARTKPPEQQESSKRSHIFDFGDSSSSSCEDVNYEDFVSHIDESDDNEIVPVYCLNDDNFDIDINTSQRIVENLHNLSNYYFSQSKIFDDEDKENISVKTIENQSSAVKEGPYSVKESESIKKEDESSKQIVLHQSISPVETEPKVEQLAQNNLKPNLTLYDKSLLDDDDDIFLSISSPHTLPQCSRKQNLKQSRIFETTPSSSRFSQQMRTNMASSTPTSDKDMMHQNKELPFPKRLRFEKDSQFSDKLPNQAFNLNSGFSTARGGCIDISDKAFKNTSNIFDEIENDFGDVHMPDALKKTNLNAFSGFQTGTGSSIKIKEDHIRKYKDVFNEIADVCGAASTAKINGGFSTARRNNIAISKEALKVTSHVFDEIQNEFSHNVNVTKPTGLLNEFGGFKTGSGCTIKISENHMQKYTDVFQQISNDSAFPIAKEIAVKCVPVSDFKTGSGKNIAITEAGIEKSTRIFEAVENEVNAMHMSAEEVLPVDKTIRQMPGFSTGRGQIIKVSETAFAKTGKIFNNIEDSLKFDDFTAQFDKTVCNNEPIPSTSRESKFLNTDDGVNQTLIETPLDTSSKSQCSLQSTLSQALPSQLNTPEFLAAMFNTPPNYKYWHSTNRNSLPTSTTACLEQQLCENDRPPNLNQETVVSGPNSTLTEDSIDFLEQLDAKSYDLLFTNFSQVSQKVTDDLKRFKQVCLANKFEDSLNESQTLLHSDVEEDGTNPVNVTEDIKHKRRQQYAKQQENIHNKKEKINARAGALYLEKRSATSKISLKELGNPMQYTLSDLEKLGVNKNLLKCDLSNLLEFKFKMIDYYPLEICTKNSDGIKLIDEMILNMDENSCVCITELCSAFLDCPSIDPKLVSNNWTRNALKWIFLKLASYELHFPKEFANKSFTPENVLRQLKYRYDREIDRAERSALRKIVEHDDIAAKPVVLFVTGIYENFLNYTLELCDGWYAIKTSTLDVALTKAVSSGKIRIGTKLIIQGAELIGLDEGCPPLELPDFVALKIHANSTRRTKWFTKLGYYRCSLPFVLPLHSIDENGGTIARLTVYILRIYPTLYVTKEKTESGQKNVFRSQQVERRQTISEDQKRLEMIERLHNKISLEVEKEYEKRRKSIKPPLRKLADIDDAEEMWELLEHSNNPEDLEMELSPGQQKMVSDYYERIYCEKMDEISRRVQEKIANAEEDKPTSTPLLKMRVTDARKPTTKTAVISIWGANNSHQGIMENRFYDIHKVSASGRQNQDMQITAGRSTTFSEIPSALSQTQELHMEMQRKVVDISEITSADFKPYFHEFDTVGYVLMIDNNNNERKFQSVFLVNANKKILCIKFWIGISEFAYDDIIKVGRFLATKNLDWRRANAFDRKGNAQCFVTNLTTFTANPKERLLSEHLHRLREEFKQIENLELYVHECSELIEQTKMMNKSIVITPLRSFNTCNVSTPSPTSSVQKKISRLNNYGEAPPLSPLTISNRNKALIRRPFKTPIHNKPSTSSNQY